MKHPDRIPSKMTQNGLAGDYREQAESSDRTVVVGVKMNSQSRELLTWALVKVAQSGDRVIALHVLGDNGRFWGRNRVFVVCVLK